MIVAQDGFLMFVTADAVDHLGTRPRHYDVVYSIFGAVWFTDPGLLVPLIRRSLTPGGVLAFAQLPANTRPPPPHRQITRHHLPINQWEALLIAAGFDRIRSRLIPAPSENEIGTVLIRCRAGG